MAESAKLLVDDVLGGYPIRQWVLSLPIPLRLLLARYPKELSKVMQIIHLGKNLMNRWKLMSGVYKSLNINTELRTYKKYRLRSY